MHARGLLFQSVLDSKGGALTQLPSHALFIHLHLHATDSGCHLSDCSVGQRPHSQVAHIVWCLPVPVAFSSIVNLCSFLLMNYKALVVPFNL